MMSSEESKPLDDNGCSLTSNNLLNFKNNSSYSVLALIALEDHFWRIIDLHKIYYEYDTEHQHLQGHEEESSDFFSNTNGFKLDPQMPLYIYLHRLMNIGRISFDELTIGGILAERFVLNSRFKLNTQVQVLKLFAIAILISLKFLHEDNFIAREDFSFISGIQQRFILSAEISFLLTLEFKIFVAEEQYLLVQKRIRDSIDRNIESSEENTERSNWPKAIRNEAVILYF